MRLRTIFAGVYGGMVLNFVIWILMGWSEIRFENAMIEVPGVLLLAAVFSIPPTLAAYAASGFDTYSEGAGVDNE